MRYTSFTTLCCALLLLLIGCGDPEVTDNSPQNTTNNARDTQTDDTATIRTLNGYLALTPVFIAPPSQAQMIEAITPCVEAVETNLCVDINGAVMDILIDAELETSWDVTIKGSSFMAVGTATQIRFNNTFYKFPSAGYVAYTLTGDTFNDQLSVKTLTIQPNYGALIKDTIEFVRQVTLAPEETVIIKDAAVTITPDFSLAGGLGVFDEKLLDVNATLNLDPTDATRMASLKFQATRQAE